MKQFPKLNFLSAGSEMGKLISNMDWSKSSIGEPENWPQNLRTALEIVLTSNIPIILFWSEELLCFYNDQFQERFLLQEDQQLIPGQSAAGSIPEFLEKIKPKVRLIMDGEYKIREKISFPTKMKGSHVEIPFTLNFSAIHDGDNEVVGVLLTFNENDDYSENGKAPTSSLAKFKQSRKMLVESERKFRLLADSINQLNWTFDADGKLNYFNHFVNKYSGIENEFMYDNGWEQLIHPEDLQNNIALWRKSISTGTDFVCEHRLRRYDGI